MTDDPFTVPVPPTVDFAHDYAHRGWGIVPLYGVDGDACRCRQGRTCPPKNRGKHPSLGGAWQKNALRSGADIEAWWEEHPYDNVGILTGPESGIFVFDVDGAAGVRSVTDFATEHGALPPTRIVRTGSGGLHYFYKHPGHFTVHSSNGWIAPGIDIRGLGGQVVAPPSVSGRGAYEVIADHPIADAPAWLLALLAEHSRHCEAGREAVVRSAERVDIEFLPPKIRDLAGTIVGEDEGRFGHFYALVAECFENGYSQGQTVTVVAPWCAAVDKFVGRVEAEVARSWGKLQEKAAKANDWLPGVAGPAPAGSEAGPAPRETKPSNAGPTAEDSGDDDDAEDDPQFSASESDIPEPVPTWRPVDLAAILAGTYVPEKPGLYPRTDGACLVYPGRVHSFHGESESGKSLIVQAECARLVKAGYDVLYLDFESDASAVVGRMLDLGCGVEDTSKFFTYVRPDNDPRKSAPERAEYAALLARDYTLVVIDGMTDALGAFGAGTMDNDEIASFMRSFPRLVAIRTGAAVAIVDHVTKNTESRGRYALGGQAKMNALDGSAFVVEVVEPLGRGMRGSVTLRVAKDRPGGVRPISGAFRSSDRTQESARVIIDSTGQADGRSIEVTVEPPTDAGDTTAKTSAPRPTTIMERISGFLIRAQGAVSGRDILAGVGGKADTARKAIAILFTEGYITSDAGPRGARMHTTILPYVAHEDELSDTYIRVTEPTHETDIEVHENRVSPSESQRVPSESGPAQSECVPSPSTPKEGTHSQGLTDEAKNNSVSPYVEVACSKCFRNVPRVVAQTFGGRCQDCGAESSEGWGYE